MNKKIKVLELFSGSRSIGKVAEKNGCEVFSVDNVAYPKTNWIGDILDWDYRMNEMQVGELKEEYVPDVIWASCPCTDFSVACIGRKWIGGEEFTPKTDLLGIKLFEKTIEIIKYYLELNPNLIWWVENPRGKMRKAPHWKTIPHTRHTVMYCQYGDNRMKPTDLWTNADGFVAKTCKNYKYDKDGSVLNRHCHHDLSQRGSTVRSLRARGIDTVKGGTETLKNNHERSKIPQQLCEEVIECSLNNLNSK